jgi:ribosomal protein S18 acetylase RimI-like enzyme
MASSELIRAATAADADAVFELMVAADGAESAQPRREVAEFLSPPSHRGWVIDAADGGIAGYAWARRGVGHASVDGDVVALPGSEPTLRSRLLARARAAAVEIDPTVPFHVFTDAADPSKREMCSAAGGTVVRRFWKMQVELAGPAPEPPELTAGVELTVVDGSESGARSLYQVLDRAFADHFGAEPTPYDEWLAQALRYCPDRTLWWLARVDGAPAAGLCGCPRASAGYIASVGTLREFRGRGVARALILAAFAEFHRRGHRCIALNVDATNPTGAVGLYESLGMRRQREELLYEFS